MLAFLKQLDVGKEISNEIKKNIKARK